ncbi:MAG: hypothetical protein ABIV25_09110 [Paracoccaceae bacterium]
MINVSMSSIHSVKLRGALPAAPMAMPAQRLEWPSRRMSRLSLLAMLLWGRPARAGR